MNEIAKRMNPQFKSERRHGLKMIDKKWGPRIAEGKATRQKIEMATKMFKNQ